MVNKHTVDYDPSLSQLISRIHPVIFLWNPKGFIFPELSWIFSLTFIFEKFQIYSVINLWDYGVEKIYKIICTWVLVTSFDKFHHLCNLFCFGLCFVVPKFSFKHAEVSRFFNLTNKVSTKMCSVQE